ncbi:hypothetical protein GGR51DRAFT_561990 [Nemania sp. FL0031]|nr:hypothetical protein GGR51DRAFT_561990 [Nemania sp. FL0031]
MGTTYEKHEGIMWRKFSRQLAAEGDIDRGITGELGIVVTYELIRCLYNQPCTRYLLEAMDPTFSSIADGFLFEVSHNISRLALTYPKSYGALEFMACAMEMVILSRCSGYEKPGTITELAELMESLSQSSSKENH